MLGQPLGLHWSTDEQWARNWAETHADLVTADGRQPIVVSIVAPAASTHQSDPQWLVEHGVGQYAAVEPEVTLLAGTPVQVVKVAIWETSSPGTFEGQWREVAKGLTTTARHWSQSVGSITASTDHLP